MGENYKMEVKVPIQYIQSDSMTFSQEPPTSVTYTIHSKGWNLLGVSKSRIEKDSLQIVLENTPQQTVSQSQLIRYIRNTSLKRFDILGTRPELLEISQEPSRHKMIPIRVPMHIQYRKNFDKVGAFSLSPDSVNVKGPASEIALLTSWTTDSLLVNDVHDTIVQELNLTTPPSKIISMNIEKTKLTIPVEQYTENTVYAPIEIINSIHPDMEIFPTRTRLKFKVPMSYYDLIGKDDFKVTVDGTSSIISENKLLIHISGKSPLVKDLDYDPKIVEFFIESD